MVPSPEPAIYQQFDHVEAPKRFVLIVDAYKLLINRTEKDFSYRELAKTFGGTHSYFTTLKAQENRKPNPLTVQAVVEAINIRVHESQQWPLEHAMEAAGQIARYRAQLQRPSLVIEKKEPKPLRQNDAIVRMPARIPIPILNIGEIQNDAQHGLADIITLRRVMNLSNNTAIIEDRVPGLDLQHTGEWVLIQGLDSPSKTEWVLVREGLMIKAVQRQAVTATQRIIAWILGIMRISG